MSLAHGLRTRRLPRYSKNIRKMCFFGPRWRNFDLNLQLSERRCKSHERLRKMCVKCDHQRRMLPTQSAERRAGALCDHAGRQHGQGAGRVTPASEDDESAIGGRHSARGGSEGLCNRRNRGSQTHSTQPNDTQSKGKGKGKKATAKTPAAKAPPTKAPTSGDQAATTQRVSRR